MGPILNGYGVMGVLCQMRSCETRNARHTMWPWTSWWQEQLVEAVIPNSLSSQLSGRVELRPAVTFSKTCLMHRPVSTDSHFMKLS